LAKLSAADAAVIADLRFSLFFFRPASSGRNFKFQIPKRRKRCTGSVFLYIKEMSQSSQVSLWEPIILCNSEYYISDASFYGGVRPYGTVDSASDSDSYPNAYSLSELDFDDFDARFPHFPPAVDA
jgi:hypothetical protein